MATEEQTAANRLNAQLGSGPKTEAGRNRSRAMNARRHGLCRPCHRDDREEDRRRPRPISPKPS